MRISPFTWMALSFFGYFCAYGVFVPFFPVWLKSLQYGEELIGLILALSYVFRFIGGIYFAALVKKAAHLPAGLRIFALLSALLMVIIGLSAQQIYLLLPVIMLFAMVNSVGIPLGDTLATTWQRQIGLDYGKVRLIGSAAFVVGVTLFGNAIGIFGEQNIVWILTALLFLYSLLQVPTPAILPADENHAAQSTGGFFSLLKDPVVLRLLIAASLIQGSHAVYYGYSVIYWTELGFSVQSTSLLWGLSVVAEILLFFFSTKLFKHWRVSALLYLSAAATCVRWLVFGYGESLWLIACFQTLHSLSYALCHYAVMRYITTRPQHTMVKLQGLYNGFATCAAVALFTALGGAIFALSPSAAFWTMAAVSASALLIIPPKIKGFLINQG
ncbi:PPP family 3-phenylpropionic acid transporter [Mesocricetibacter intestinalis]|uniref:PPP family 3-phenylpropionic acid transporter n=1 Tax=Mesocricetibacter intestinalis TaxID=1521930 RepID=A0A4R6V9B0_9PAST|nr:3-phenylpropionate MFS transporter [Mesocricetibacter intestinalis]TDQ58090.1 PPP family 3-phenylpropionic acid transporter [Mesocricetibacter intestinalis]